MIAKLTMEEYTLFLAYFEDVNDDDEWAKIGPKQFGDTEFFIVKTFRTQDTEY